MAIRYILCRLFFWFCFLTLCIAEFNRSLASLSVTARAFAYTYLSCRTEKKNNKDCMSVRVMPCKSDE